MSAYRVGQVHPTAGRRQFHQLSDGEIADLGLAVVHALAGELRRLNVAGGEMASTWELAEQIRTTIVAHHESAFRRWRAQRLER